jgi:hypothetical protein
MKKYKYTISTQGYYKQDSREEFDLYSDKYYSSESFQNFVSRTFAEVYKEDYSNYPNCNSGYLIYKVLDVLKKKYRFTTNDDRYVTTFRLKSDIKINNLDEYIKNYLDGDESELDEDARLFFKHLKKLQNEK